MIRSLIVLSLLFGQLQEDELQLSLRRNFGYRAGSTIQGSFTASVRGASDLVQVTYVIDGETMAVVSEPPFDYSFSTSEYPLGRHELWVVGTTEAGRELRSAPRSFEFVSASDSWRAAGRLLRRMVDRPVGSLVLRSDHAEATNTRRYRVQDLGV